MKGVIQDKNILCDIDDVVTFQYFDSTDKRWKKRSLPALEFLHLILQHVLPKGFRRTRDYGFLHGNAQKKRTKFSCFSSLHHHSSKPNHPPDPFAPIATTLCSSSRATCLQPKTRLKK
ncbi:MAG: transposase [Deltaproteobacteria bacterium]|nr:transposase [Deltaproteobacteria bacterium]